MRIAVIDEDAHQASEYDVWLNNAGHSTKNFASVTSFIQTLRPETFDLVIVGSMPDHGDAEASTVMLREKFNMQIPVLRLLMGGSERAIVAALKAGADDCMVKPLRQLEFLARVEALLRRAHATHGTEQIEYGALSVDLKNRVITRNGAVVTLTPKTYDLAVFLLHHTGQLLSRDDLMARIWGNDRGATRTLDTHISRLRTVLGLTPEYGWRLQSVYQHGYRLDQVAPIAGARVAGASTKFEAVEAFWGG